jgi:hypothetical protein
VTDAEQPQILHHLCASRRIDDIASQLLRCLKRERAFYRAVDGEAASLNTYPWVDTGGEDCHGQCDPLVNRHIGGSVSTRRNATGRGGASHANLINAPYAFPPPRRILSLYRHAVAKRIAMPAPAIRHPMSCDLNYEWCVHVGLRSLPSCKCRRERTSVKIGDKDHS